MEAASCGTCVYERVVLQWRWLAADSTLLQLKSGVWCWAEKGCYFSLLNCECFEGADHQLLISLELGSSEACKGPAGICACDKRRVEQ